MKQLAGLSAGALALAAAYCSPAAADGMPRRAAPPPPAPVVQDRCAPGPWTGFYVGGNLGWGHSEGEFNDHDKIFSDKHGFDNEDNAFVGGVQSGYNLQCGNVVFGFESDINWVGFDDNNRNDGHRYEYDGDDFRHRRTLDWFGTVRGRIGWTNDRVMVYATGGLAYGEPEHRWDGHFRLNNYNDDMGRHKNSNNVEWGWTAGGGVEFLHSDRFTIKAEALWVRFDNDSKDFKYTFTERYKDSYYGPWKYRDHEKKARFSHEDDMVVVRVGLNYKFGDRTPVYEPLK